MMEDLESPSQGAATLSVIVPAYNEERGLPGTLRSLTGFLEGKTWNWEVRVVDDGSADGTRQVVEQFSRIDSRVVLQAEPHRGKGGAVRAGRSPCLTQ